MYPTQGVRPVFFPDNVLLEYISVIFIVCAAGIIYRLMLDVWEYKHAHVIGLLMAISITVVWAYCLFLMIVGAFA